MANTTIDFTTTVSINELRRALPIYGPHITMLITGEPGTGKSTLLYMLQEDLGDEDYDYIYIDAPNKDIGDISLNIPVHEEKQLQQYTSKIFNMGNGKKKVIMIDEILKCNRMLKLMLNRLILERYVGDDKLPDGSIVFATSNNLTDGLSDTIEGHTGNRLTIVRMEKPTADEWLVWATNNKISSQIRAWVAMEPRCMKSYLEKGQDDNPYIFNPFKPQVSFVSPRSLAKSDPIVRNAVKVGQNMTRAALEGTIGEAAANSMAAFLTMEKEILRTKEIIKDPMGAPVPDKMAAVFMMMFNATDDIETQDDLSAFLQYLNRIGSREVEAVFYTMLCQGKRTVRLAKGNTVVNSWAAKNIELF